MIQKIKELIVFFKIWQEVKQSPAIFKVVHDLFKFVETTHEAQKPLVTEIAIFNMADGTKISDFVSIWAGIGADNPVKRIEKLKLRVFGKESPNTWAFMQGMNLPFFEKEMSNSLLAIK